MAIEHKLRLYTGEHLKDIIYERPVFSIDGKSMSCIVPQKYGLTTNDSILVDIDNSKTPFVVKIDMVEDFVEQGFADIETVFELYPYKWERFSLQANHENEMVIWRYFLYHDGCIKGGYEVQDNNSDEKQLYFPELGVSTIEYDPDQNLINIPVPYYVQDGRLTYGNIDISVRYNENNDVNVFQTLEKDWSIYIQNGERSKWRALSKITFTIPDNILIPIDKISGAQTQSYIIVDDVKYPLSERIESYTPEIYDDTDDENTEIKQVEYVKRYVPREISYDGNEYAETIDTTQTDLDYLYTNEIKVWDNKTVFIETEMVTSDEPESIFLYANSDSFSNIYNSKYIIAERTESVIGEYFVDYNEDGVDNNVEGNAIVNLLPSSLYSGSDDTDMMVSPTKNKYTVTIDDVIYNVFRVKMLDFTGLREIYKVDRKENNDSEKDSKEDNISSSTPEQLFYVIMGSGNKVYFKLQKSDSVIVDDLGRVCEYGKNEVGDDVIINYLNEDCFFYVENDSGDQLQVFKSLDDDNFYYFDENHIVGGEKKVVEKNKTIYYEKYVLMYDTTISYPVQLRDKITVDDIEYYKSPDFDGNLNKFYVPSKPTVMLIVDSVKAPNIYNCKDVDDLTNYLTPRKYEKQWLYRDLTINSNKYIFKLPPKAFFDRVKEGDKNIFQIISDAYNDFVDPVPRVTIKEIISDINIPLQMCTLHGTNLNQEDLVKKQFAEDKSKGYINRIVDMEKDIYSACRLVEDSDRLDRLVEVTDVEFLLHLRTRNEFWEVREDFMCEFTDSFGSADTTGWRVEDGKFYNQDKEVSEKQVPIGIKTALLADGIGYEDNDDYTKTSWNIYDYYKGYCKKLLTSTDSADDFEKYYQPSDLIGFFGFTDDDVYYQKKKIQKSFLRLSFFDSKDPNTQSLLGTSTIFMDSETLYGKFVGNTLNPNPDVKYMDPVQWSSSSNNIESKFIGVNKEAVADSPKYRERSNILDDAFRISSKMTVSNKYATNSSSEGFYNYIFREYTEGLHERTIYLKIQFNHAGAGVVLDMLQPTKRNENGQVCIGGIDSLPKEGVPLSQLADMLYIPIKVRYDEELKKYCWYLPKEMVKHKEDKIIFNLYEIKISKLG